jgi:hypothetical protein
VHPVGSYCTDVSRCTVNKTLFMEFRWVWAWIFYTPVTIVGAVCNGNEHIHPSERGKRGAICDIFRSAQRCYLKCKSSGILTSCRLVNCSLRLKGSYCEIETNVDLLKHDFLLPKQISLLLYVKIVRIRQFIRDSSSMKDLLNDKAYYYYYYYYYTIWMSFVTGLFFLVLLLNQQWTPSLRLQASHCFTLQHFPYYVWCSKYNCLL